MIQTSAYQVKFWLTVVLFALIANAVVLLDTPLVARQVAATLLVFLLTGAALVQVVFPLGWFLPVSERMVLSAGASVALVVWLLWLLFLLPLRLDLNVMLAALDGSILLAAGLSSLRAWRQSTRRSPAKATRQILLRSEVWLLAILTIVTAVQLGYALTNIQFADFVYDERVVLYSAVDVLLGKKDSLFDMPRGSAQILLVMGFVRLTGSLTEEVGRQPFALCAVLAVAAFTLIARFRLKYRVVLLAGLLFTLEGLLLSLARWLQYQMFVLAMMQLALYCALRAWATRKSALSNRYWFLCALFEGLALLGHYDAAFIGPALLYLFVRSHDRPLMTRHTFLKVAAFVGAIVLLSVPYYLMLIQHPDTMSRFEFLYVRDSGRLGLSRAPFNNLSTFFWDLMYFESVYRAPVTVAALFIAALLPLKSRSLSARVSLAWLGSVLLVALTIWQPGLMTFAGINFSVVPFCLLFLLGCWKIARDPFWIAILLWIFAVFFVTGFWMERPVDHYFSGLAPLLLVASKGLSELFRHCKRWLSRWQLRLYIRLGFALSGLWLALLADYVYMQAVVHLPATLSMHPEGTPPLFRQLAEPRTVMPSTRILNEGWRTVAALYETGELRGEYDTNIGRAAQWYIYHVWDPPQPHPRYFINSAFPNPRDVTSAMPLDFADTFQLWGTIKVDDEPGLVIYQRKGDVAVQRPRIIQAGDYVWLWPQIASLTRLERFKANKRDDAVFFAIARSLLSRGRTGDAVAFDEPETSAILNRYYSADLPYVTPSSVEAGIYQRIWGIFWQVTGGPVEQALAQKTYPLTAEWVGNVRLQLYGIAPDAPVHEVGARLGDFAVLRRAAILPLIVKPGTWLPVQLEWQAANRTDTHYKVFVHLANAQGEPSAQADGEPVAGLRPTTGWHPDETIFDRIGVDLPAELKPGEYQMLVGLYDAAPGGGRLPALAPDGSRYANDAVSLGRLTVVSN